MSDEGIITLTSDSGEDENFGFLDFIEYDGDEYIILYPLEREDKRLVIFKVEDDATNEEYDSFVGIDDDELIQNVYEEFLRQNEETE